MSLFVYRYFFYEKDKKNILYLFEKKEDKAVIEIGDFSDSLRNIGKLAESFKDSKFTLTVLPIGNKTANRGSIPSDITVMGESAINKIGSHKIVGVPYDFADPKNVNGDYFWIKGAITEINTDKTKYSLKVDFNIVNARTKQFIPGVHSEVSISKYLTKNNKIGISINSSSYKISGNILKNYDTHSMIRVVINLSMVELIGKLRTYPYWYAIKGSKANLKTVERMKKDFNRFEEETRKIYIQHLLSLIYDDVKVGAKTMVVTNKRIVEFKTKYNLSPADEKIDSKLYAKLLNVIAKESLQK